MGHHRGTRRREYARREKAFAEKRLDPRWHTWVEPSGPDAGTDRCWACRAPRAAHPRKAPS